MMNKKFSKQKGLADIYPGAALISLEIAQPTVYSFCETDGDKDRAASLALREVWWMATPVL
jgi:hypothetical protein